MVRLACWRIPPVSNMDEFSVLLGADTFRHLRLTNPTHPLWQSFETLHVIQIPSYASKFPPAPAALIALAESIFGQPIWGSWLAVAVGGIAVFWMFAGWLPCRWAFVGGLVAAANPVMLSWGRNYLACGIGLAGAALAIGGAVRIVRRRARSNGAIMALGLAVLANSRPYEGLVLACLLIGWVALRARPRRLFSAVAGALPAGLVVLGFMSYYNWSVTRNLFELPYVSHHKQYDMAPSFFFQDPQQPPEYRDAHIWQFHRWELACWESYRAGDLWNVIWPKVRTFRIPVLSPLAITIIFLPWAWRSGWVRFAAIGTAVMGTAMLFPLWLNLNYTAPILALFFIVELGCLQAGVGLMRDMTPMFRTVVGVALIIASLTVGVLVAQRINTNDSLYGERRENIVNALNEYPEGNVVFVRYAPVRNLFEEWVYNSADIDGQRVIWALDKGPEQNAAVMRYYSGRKFWLLLPDIKESGPYEIREQSLWIGNR
jgi:hypothetical protein